MNIQQPEGALEKILRSGLWVDIAPTSKATNIDSFMKTIDIDIVGDPVVYRDGSVRIYPVWKSSKVVLDLRLNSDDEDALMQEIVLPDFRNSENFYKTFQDKKVKFKIMEDRCSFHRSSILYEHIARMEGFIRKKFVAEVGFQNIPKPKTYHKEAPDHKAAQFDLFELTSVELLKPCSDAYFKSQIELGVDPVDARQLTKLNEYSIPMSSGELNRFRKARNAIMHFRVLTNEDAEFVIRAEAKLYKFHMMDTIYRSVNKTIELKT